MKSTLIKALFTKYIKQHLPEAIYHYKSNMIYCTRDGMLKGFYFNSSAFSSSQFEIVVFILPLYIPTEFISLTFGHFLRNPSKRQWWEYDENRLEDLGKELALEMIAAESNFLSQINTALDFYNYYKKDKTNNIRYYEAVSYSAAYAEIANVNDILNDFLLFLGKKDKIKIDWVREIYNNVEMLLKNEKKPLLYKWEEKTKAALKI